MTECRIPVSVLRYFKRPRLVHPEEFREAVAELDTTEKANNSIHTSSPVYVC